MKTFAQVEACYDSSSDRYTLYTSNQNPHIIRVLLSDSTLGISEEKIRVVAPDVGGGFGMKITMPRRKSWSSLPRAA
ncbi:MAG TPA: molybdopterin cofactor-binding domain-containing protein [Dongiaceae bacterium]|nr:molybdopterin cofactor-binding domain-containing protein [Dongiaceae bacterium]